MKNESAMLPRPALYVDGDGGESDVMFGQGSWFDRGALVEGSIVSRYLCDGWWLQGILLDCTESWCWRMNFACNNSDLIIYRGRTREKARAEFPLQVHNGLTRVRSLVSKTSSDMFCFRRHGETGYLAALNEIPSSMIDDLQGMYFFTPDVWV